MAYVAYQTDPYRKDRQEPDLTILDAGVRVRDTPAWDGPLVLRHAAVGEPSTGKSAALAPMRPLLDLVEQERRATHAATSDGSPGAGPDQSPPPQIVASDADPASSARGCCQRGVTTAEPACQAMVDGSGNDRGCRQKRQKGQEVEKPRLNGHPMSALVPVNKWQKRQKVPAVAQLPETDLPTARKSPKSPESRKHRWHGGFAASRQASLKSLKSLKSQGREQSAGP